MCCNRISRKLLLAIAAIGLVIGLGRFAAAANAEHHAEDEAAPSDEPATPAVLNFKVKDIHGEDVDLAKYHGKVVLIVNVASRCGNTPQYEQLQELHEQYADDGLAILGFPANNFGGQEPGSDAQILEFCESTYGVQFDMFSKISVAGDDQAPLYGFLTSEETNPSFGGNIRWNFDKFLVSRTGEIVARFDPRAKPDNKDILDTIKAELEKPTPEGVEHEAEEAEAE